MIRTANDLKKDNIREQLNQQKLGPYFPQIIADIPIMFGRPNSVYQFYVKNLAELKLQVFSEFIVEKTFFNLIGFYYLKAKWFNLIS